MNKRFLLFSAFFTITLVGMEQDLGSEFSHSAGNPSAMVISNTPIQTPGTACSLSSEFDCPRGRLRADSMGGIARDLSEIYSEFNDSSTDAVITNSAKKRKVRDILSSPSFGGTPSRDDAIQLLESMDDTPGDSKLLSAKKLAGAFMQEAVRRSNRKRSRPGSSDTDPAFLIGQHDEDHKVIQSNKAQVSKVIGHMHKLSQVFGEEALTDFRVADLDHIALFSKKKGGGHEFNNYELGTLTGPAFVSPDGKVILAKGVHGSNDRKILQKDFSPEKIVQGIRTDPIAKITPHKNMHQLLDGTIVGAIKDRSTKIGYRSVFPLVGICSKDDASVLLGRLSVIEMDHSISHVQDVVVSKDEYNLFIQQGIPLRSTKKSPMSVIDISTPVKNQFGALFAQHGVSVPTIYGIIPKP